jgi:hypothetical protein
MLSPLSLIVTTQFLSHRNYFSVFLSQCGFSPASVCVYESESERREREGGREREKKIEKMSETAIHGVERERGGGEEKK